MLLVLLLCWDTSFVLAADEANKPVLSDVTLSATESHLLLFAKVSNVSSPELGTAIQSGMPVKFTFTVELEATRSFWFDSTLASITVVHSLTYDPLKQLYTVTSSHGDSEARQFKTMEQALDAMARLSGLEVIERTVLQADAAYALRLKVKLWETTLPLGMHVIVPFVSMWDVETDWRIIEFRY